MGEQGRPGRLREAVEGSLRRRLEQIDLYQLARIDVKQAERRR